MTKPEVLAVDRVVTPDKKEKIAIRAVFRWNLVKVIFVRGEDGKPVISARINTEGARGGSERTHIPPRRYAEIMRMVHTIFSERSKVQDN